jgi:hypothetical protein
MHLTGRVTLNRAGTKASRMIRINRFTGALHHETGGASDPLLQIPIRNKMMIEFRLRGADWPADFQLQQNLRKLPICLAS